MPPELFCRPKFPNGNSDPFRRRRPDVQNGHRPPKDGKKSRRSPK